MICCTCAITVVESTVESGPADQAQSAAAAMDASANSPEYDDISDDDLDELIGGAESEVEDKDKVMQGEGWGADTGGGGVLTALSVGDVPGGAALGSGFAGGGGGGDG